MAAGTFNFRIEQGTTYAQLVRVRDGDGNPIDLTGWNVRMDIRETRSKDAPLVLELTEGNDRIQITDAPNGEIIVQLTSVETANLAASRWPYDVELFDDATPAQVIRLLQGTVSVSAEVTE